MRTGGQPAEYNVALIGCLGVGKSAMTVKYLTRRFINEYDPHLEDCYVKNDCLEGQDCVIRVMDTYDKEASCPDRYLTWADAFIIVYSVTSRSSFEKAQIYLEMVIQCQRLKGTNNPCILCGNKMDLERYREVTEEEGQNLANRYDAVFLECTAAEEFENVERVFHEAVLRVRRQRVEQVGGGGGGAGTTPLHHLYLPQPTFQTSPTDTPILAALLNPTTTATLTRTTFRRSKSPNPTLQHSASANLVTESPGTEFTIISSEPVAGAYQIAGDAAAMAIKPNLPKRTSSSFRLFNKGFKNIFLNQATGTASPAI